MADYPIKKKTSVVRDAAKRVNPIVSFAEQSANSAGNMANNVANKVYDNMSNEEKFNASLKVMTAPNDNTTNAVPTATPVTDAKDVSDLDGAISYLKGQMDMLPNAETPEQRKARERRERRTMWLSHLADGLGTFHTAYSHARGVQPMQLTNMSDKARERLERAKALREGNEDRRLKYMSMINQLEGQKWTRQHQADTLQLQRDKLEYERKRKQEIADAQVKAAEARAKKDEATADFYDRKAYFMELGYESQEAERKARTANLWHNANKPYSTGSGGGNGSGNGNSRSGFDKTKYKRVLEYNSRGKVIGEYYVPIEDGDVTPSDNTNNRTNTQTGGTTQQGGGMGKRQLPNTNTKRKLPNQA